MYRFLEKRYKEILVALILLLVLITVNSFHRIGRDVRWYDKAVMFIMAPAQYTVNSLVRGSVYFWQNYIHLTDVKEDNDLLSRENSELRNKLQNSIEIGLENSRLRKLLEFKDKMALSVIPAEVVSRDSGDIFKTLRINKGERQGIKVSMPVVSYDGVVGNIIRVFPEYSDILLITDPNFVLDAIVEENRTRGMIEGVGLGVCRLKYVNRLDDVKVGNRISTSGMEQRFPKGLLIGFVTEIKRKNYGITQRIIVEPAVDFSKLEEVLVVSASLGL